MNMIPHDLMVGKTKDLECHICNMRQESVLNSLQIDQCFDEHWHGFKKSIYQITSPHKEFCDFVWYRCHDTDCSHCVVN